MKFVDEVTLISWEFREQTTEIQRDLHAKVYTIASDIASMDPDPLFPEHTPNGVVVGGYAQDFDSNRRDVDFEVYGVSSDHLIREIPKLECFLGRIDRIEIRGNAYKAISVVLKDGSKFEFSVPILEPTPPKRYKESSIVEDPTIRFKDACQRRRFTLDSFAYDPLTDTEKDPFNGRQDLKDKILRAVTPWFSSDPINLPYTIGLLAREGWKASEALERTLKEMIKNPGDRTSENFSDYRFRWEISRWFVSGCPPSSYFKVAENLGFLDVEVPSLGNIRQRYSVWEPVLGLMDEVWRISKEENAGEAVSIGRQIGILFAGISEADKIIFNRRHTTKVPSDLEEIPDGLIGLAKALVYQSEKSTDPNATFDEVVRIAHETSNNIVIFHGKAEIKSINH